MGLAARPSCFFQRVIARNYRTETVSTTIGIFACPTPQISLLTKKKHLDVAQITRLHSNALYKHPLLSLRMAGAPHALMVRCPSWEVRLSTSAHKLSRRSLFIDAAVWVWNVLSECCQCGLRGRARCVAPRASADAASPPGSWRALAVGRWRGEKNGRYRCLTLRYSLLLSVWVDPSAEHSVPKYRSG